MIRPTHYFTAYAYETPEAAEKAFRRLQPITPKFSGISNMRTPDGQWVVCIVCDDQIGAERTLSLPWGDGEAIILDYDVQVLLAKRRDVGSEVAVQQGGAVWLRENMREVVRVVRS